MAIATTGNHKLM